MESLKAQPNQVTPFVSTQKEDVIYIKNPAAAWKFGRVVKMNGGD